VTTGPFRKSLLLCGCLAVVLVSVLCACGAGASTSNDAWTSNATSTFSGHSAAEGVPVSTEEAASVAITSRPAEGEDTDSFRTVVDPYHNEYGDVTGLYVDELSLEVDAKVKTAALPDAVPAYRAVLRPLPSTDLDFTAVAPPDPAYPRPYLWQDPEMDERLTGRESGSDRYPLHGTDVALAEARSFLEAHGLWQSDLLPGEVSEGSSVTAATKTLTSWNVRFQQATTSDVAAVFSGSIPGALDVRVGPLDRAIQVQWSLLDLTQDGSIRLRPLAEVLADPDAWKKGSAGSEVTGEPIADLHVAVTGVSLGLQRVTGARTDDVAAQYLVPVYRFAVQVIRPDESLGEPGIWTVVAAMDVER
jgi:hypothetical protein